MNFDELLPRKEWLAHVQRCWQPEVSDELIPLAQAAGRISSESCRCRNQLPVHRAAQQDGVAVQSTAFSCGVPDTSRWQRDRDYCLADMGDDFSNLFDVVIPIEKVVFLPAGGLQLALKEVPSAGQGIRSAGSFLAKGDELVKEGAVLTPLHLTNLAAGGYTQIRVRKQPRVTLIPTGSELVELGTSPQRGQNIETNSLLVNEIMKQWGAVPEIKPICSDDYQQLKATVFNALETADLLLLNGGSSKGEEDLCRRLLASEGQAVLHGARCVPGRPVGFGLIKDKPVINIPGPPAATLSVLSWCVKELFYYGMGTRAPGEPVTAVLQEAIAAPPYLDFFQRLQLTVADGQLLARPLKMQDKNSEVGQECNGWLIVKAGESCSAGSQILAQRMFATV